jgi:hypothetical protein
MRSRLTRTALAVTLLACLAVLGPRGASAGDRELEVLFVNMTPDALTSPASRACVQAVRTVIAADYSRVTAMGETALRKAVGVAKGGAPFLDWPHASFAKVKRRGDSSIDTVVLVDCRPEAGQLDVLVAPASSGTARYQLRLPRIDERAARWVGAAVLRRAWTGFSP